MKKLLLFFFLVISAAQLNAAIFTVTSNANAGAGTLREAIMLANANGAALVDYIYFNLPGSTTTDVTIALESELPALTSNIVLDATSQPFSALQNPNIKISLIRIVADYFNGLRADNASNIEIYGFSFSNFKADPLGPIDEKKGGIFLMNSSNIIIGAPNKPNCFGANYAGILSPYVIPRTDVQNVKISSNIFGLGENGLNNVPNESGIDLSFLKNSIIGGDTPEEGNLIATNTRNGIALGAADGSIKIANNIIGLDKNLNLKVSNLANGVYVNGTASVPNITDNIVAGQFKGIFVDFVNGSFIIARNRIGTGLLGTENFANGTAIHVNFSNKKSIIGGANISEANFISNNKIAVLIENSYPISILKNSIYCNLDAILFKNQSLNQAKIEVIKPNEVSGLYSANSFVELFYTDDCGDCQGKTWFATLNTDGAGAWKYTGAVTGKITSLGTDENGATSNFSKPQIDDASVIKMDVFCGETNGSITGLKIYNSSIFHWFNAAGQIIGTESELKNVGAGTYYLKAGQLGLCDVRSADFTIGSIGNGIDDKNKRIKDALCGGADGSIENIAISNNLPRIWYNSAGTAIATSDNLINVPAGSYYFTSGNGSCPIKSIIYTIANKSPTYTVKDFVIVNASCGLKNGGITIKNYQTDTPTQFSWQDGDGNEISSDENLTDVFPGTYILIASNGGNCSNKAGQFTVAETELPVIDVSKLQSSISCDGKSVSVLGLEVIGTTQPYSFLWLDDKENVISASLNFESIKVGNYQLVVTDKFGCKVNSDFIDFNKLESKVLQVPNSITPNGDGINDTWRILGAANNQNAEFFVFNRNGDQLFYSKGYTKEFDGTYNGKPLSIGVYYYLIDLKTDCGKLSGSLTILK